MIGESRLKDLLFYRLPEYPAASSVQEKAAEAEKEGILQAGRNSFERLENSFESTFILS